MDDEGEQRRRRGGDSGAYRPRRGWRRSAEDEWLQELSEDAVERTSSRFNHAIEEATGPRAVLIDDGELDDIAELLAEAGNEPLRLGPSEIDQLEWPRDLLVVAARVALSLRLPLDADVETPLTIAVAENGSQSVSSSLRQLGFKYVVSRPVHREALRLLLLQGIYSGANRRTAPRRPFGCDVALRIGWRRGQGTLTEASLDGCRLLTREAVEIGQTLTIRLPREHAGGHALSLKGSVVRRDRNTSRIGPRGASLGVVFEGMAPKTRERLQALLSERETGPSQLSHEEAQAEASSVRDEPHVEPEPSVLNLSGSKPATPRAQAAPVPKPPERPRRQSPVVELPPRAAPVRPVAADVPAPPAREVEAAEEVPEAPPGGIAKEAPFATDEPLELETEERRFGRRAVLNREVVALDAQAQRVTHTLMGTDLSETGIRVQRHHGLSVGDALRVALYDAQSSAAVVVEARIERDDGDRGYLLRFANLIPEQVKRIDRIVDALPEVQSSKNDGDMEKIYLAEILGENSAR